MSTRPQLRVLAGPYRAARRYAKSRGWAEDTYIIVTRGHQLARLDPQLMRSIITVALHSLGQGIAAEIQHEVSMIRALWPVPMTAVTA